MDKYGLENIAASVCALFKTQPNKSWYPAIPELTTLAVSAVSGSIDRCLFYSPDCVGRWIYNKYYDKFAPVRKYAPVEIKLHASFMPKTPVCFATMFSGVTPDVHGIKIYERPQLAVDTLFDALARDGKRCLIIAKKNYSMDVIFRARDVDHCVSMDDTDATEKACEYIEKDMYSLIMVYNSAFDDYIHHNPVESSACINALQSNIDNFKYIMETINNKWRKHNTLVTFCPDHGLHNDPGTGNGNHGLDIPEDMELTHLFGFIGAQA